MPIDGVGSQFQFGFGRQIVRPLFRGLGIAASGLSAQRQRMETIGTNIANAETTRTDAGGPYRRRMVQLEAQTMNENELTIIKPGHLIPSGVPAGELPPPDFVDDVGVRVAAIAEDNSEGALIYDPSHPDADDKGYVRMPNVNITDELVDMMDARRMYEANATVFQAMKNMLQRAIQI
jgi:flagellar basal-body rod protein FlgC